MNPPNWPASSRNGPRSHRFPASNSERVQQLSRIIVQATQERRPVSGREPRAALSFYAG